MRNNKLNILFTGLSGNDSALQSLINSDIVNFIHFPTIEITASELTLDEKNKIERASNYDYIIFTSVNGVKYFLDKYKDDFSSLNCNTSIVAIGKKTASLLISKNIDVDLIPSNSSSESINQLLSENLVNEKSILIPGSKLSNSNLYNLLEAKGAMVDFIAVYENNIPNIVKPAIQKDIIDLVIFTSPSTFYNFISIFEIDNLQKYFTDRTIAAIGSVTKESIESKNLKVQIVPKEYNLVSLTKEIENYYKLN